MKHSHFEAFRPQCPHCFLRGLASPVRISLAILESDDALIEGVLQCTARGCELEYPVIDGIPILVPDVRRFLAASVPHITARADLSAQIESMLSEGCGPGSAYDLTRSHLSSYTWDHYGEFDPVETGSPRPGMVTSALTRGLELTGPLAGPVLDAGCSVGRATFELAARTGQMTLGVDMNFAMLALAARVMRTGAVRYPRRSAGLLYERREFAAKFESAGLCDFWCANAAALPLAPGTLGGIVALNVIDCVPQPVAALKRLADCTRAGGRLLVATPYDWSPGATPVEEWLGGHSPRGLGAGRPEEVLRAILTKGAHPSSLDSVKIIAEAGDVPWQVRMHDRSVTNYRLHMVAAARV